MSEPAWRRCALFTGAAVIALTGVCLGQTRGTRQRGGLSSNDPNLMLVSELRLKIMELERQLLLEQSKSRRLQADLDRLRLQLVGTGTTPSPVPPPPTTERHSYVAFPKRRVSGLGVIQRSETKLTEPIDKAQRVAVVPLDGGKDLGKVEIAADPNGQIVRFLCNHAVRGKTAVASVELKNRALLWTWNRGSPRGLTDALDRLDECLKTSLIEVRSDREVVAKYQVAPETIELRLLRNAVTKQLPQVWKGMRLRAGPTPSGWSVVATETNALRFSDGNTSLTMRLDLARKVVTAALESPSTAVQIKAIDNEIAGWQNDIDTLEERKKSSTSTTRARLDQQIDTYKKRIVDLKAKKAALTAESQKAGVSPKAYDCRAQVVLTNGVVLFEIELKR